MKKILILFLSTLFILTGCTNYTELNDLSIINEIGIEKENSIYKVTISVVDTNHYENDDNYKKNIYEATGMNLTDAFNNLYLYLDKEIYIHHLETLLLSNTLNHEDIDNINTYFNNIKNNRNSFTLVYTDSSIKDVLSTDKSINSLIETNSNNYFLVYPLTYETYLKTLYEKKYSFIPTIRYTDKDLTVVGYSYFYKNKHINLLTQEDNLSYNIINNHINTINLSIDKNYYSISSLDTTLNINSNKTNINISSLIYSKDTDYINKYNTYIKKIIDNFINKYGYYKEYSINTYTKGEKYEE